MTPRSSDGGSAAATANPAEAPRAQRKNAELAVGGGGHRRHRVQRQRSAAQCSSRRCHHCPFGCRISTPPMIALPRMMSVGAPAGSVAVRLVDDAAEDCQDVILDPPAARDVDLDPAPERQHVDHRLGRDLRVREVDLASAHDRDGVAADEVARRHAAADPPITATE